MKRIGILLMVMAIASASAGCREKVDKEAEPQTMEAARETDKEPETEMIKIQQAGESQTGPPQPKASPLEPEGTREAGGETPLAEEMEKEPETQPAKVYNVTAMQKTMYAIQPVHVRKSYTKQSDILTSLGTGQKVAVTGIAANGWIRIVYNGQDAFVYKAYLSEENPADKRQTASLAPSVEETPAGSVQPSPPAVVPIPKSGNSGQGSGQGNGPGSGAVTGVNGGPGVSLQPGLTAGPGGGSPSSGVITPVGPGPS